MKLILITAMLLSACNLFTADNVKTFIPGTFIAEWKNEFSESRDTMQIELLTAGGSETYKITRRTSFHYRRKKKRGPEYKIIHWTGSYDEKQRTVVINNSGRVLSFDPSKMVMKMGTITYKKI